MARSSTPTTRKPRAAKPKPELAVISDEPADLKTALEKSVEAAGDKPKARAKKPTATKEIAVPKSREVSADKQATIDRIVELRKQGMGLPTICKTLDSENVKPFGKADHWYPPVVRGILNRNGVSTARPAKAGESA